MFLVKCYNERMKKYYFIIVFVVVVVASLFLLYFSQLNSGTQLEQKNSVTNVSTSTTSIATTSTAVTSSSGVKHFIDYGKITLKVGETVVFKNQSITLVKVLADSRCPSGVTCIWAGTVNAEVEIITNNRSSLETIELGKSSNVGGIKIELLSVLPSPVKDIIISSTLYRLTFNVVPQVDIVNTPKKITCYVGGCSSELCTDKIDAISACMFRAEFQCYKQAVCEQQLNGVCGWTETSTLKSCILDATQAR